MGWYKIMLLFLVVGSNRKNEMPYVRWPDNNSKSGRDEKMISTTTGSEEKKGMRKEATMTVLVLNY